MRIAIVAPLAIIALSSTVLVFARLQEPASARSADPAETEAEASRAAELKRMETEVRDHERTIEELRRQNDVAAADAIRRRKELAATSPEELEKRFDELAEGVDPEVVQLARLLLFKKKAARGLIMMQAKQEAGNALDIRIRGIEEPPELTALQKDEDGYATFEKAVTKGVAETQALDADILDLARLKALGAVSDEEALKILRDQVRARQHEAAEKFYGEIESTYGPRVREFVALQLEGNNGFKSTFEQNVIGGTVKPYDWWTPVTRALGGAPERPFGQITRTMLPSEIDSIGREFQKILEQEKEPEKTAIAQRLESYLNRQRWQSTKGLQIIGLARKIAP